MKTKIVLFVFSLFSVLSITASTTEKKPLTEKEIIKLLGSFSPIKRNIEPSVDDIVFAVHSDNNLEISFYQPLGRVKLSVYSSGKLIFNEIYEITDYSTILYIHLNNYQKDFSSIEIIFDNGHLYGQF